MQGFKKFLLRGNVADLAVGVVIGAGFSGMVTAFVGDILTPFIAAVGGEPDFSAWSFKINGSIFKFGDFINHTISFVITALVVYFFVVLPMNKLIERMRLVKPVDPTTKRCPECLSEIPLKATRCAFCTCLLRTEKK